MKNRLILINILLIAFGLDLSAQEVEPFPFEGTKWLYSHRDQDGNLEFYKAGISRDNFIAKLQYWELWSECHEYMKTDCITNCSIMKDKLLGPVK